jgi:RNA polymerase sigma factor (sigma-70 family)
MSPDGSVTTWLAQLKDGETAALAKLHARYWRVLVDLARRKLHGAPSRAADEEDVAQEAFCAFYSSMLSGQLPQVRDRCDFLALLTCIIACRAKNQIKRETRDKRPNPRRFVDVSVLNISTEDRELPPEQQALVKDFYEHFITALAEPMRVYAELHLAGFNNAEIARRVNRSEQTVSRKLLLIQTKWRQLGEKRLQEAAVAIEEDSARAGLP